MQRSPESDPYTGQTEPPPPGYRGQRTCFKSLHRTAGPQRLLGRYVMHQGDGYHEKIAPARPGALAIAHLRNWTDRWSWHPSAAADRTPVRDDVFLDAVRKRVACAKRSTHAEAPRPAPSPRSSTASLGDP